MLQVTLFGDKFSPSQRYSNDQDPTIPDKTISSVTLTLTVGYLQDH